MPLAAAAGKKLVAKELMLWEGDADYWRLGPGGFIALEGVLAAPSGADDADALRERLLELVALARLTKRTRAVF